MNEFKKRMKRKSQIQIYFVVSMVVFIFLIFVAARFGLDGLMAPFGLCVIICFIFIIALSPSIGEDTAMAISESNEKDKEK